MIFQPHIPLYTQIKVVSNAWLQGEETAVTTRHFLQNYNRSSSFFYKVTTICLLYQSCQSETVLQVFSQRHDTLILLSGISINSIRVATTNEDDKHNRHPIRTLTLHLHKILNFIIFRSS